MFSKSCKYAIRAVLYLAINTNNEKKVRVVKIAEALDVPGPFLAKILQQLSKQGFVRSSKGLKGGFFLSEENKKNTILDIIYCIDGKDTFTTCFLGLPVCSSTSPCPFHEEASQYREAIMDMTSSKTIEEFAQTTQTTNLAL